MQSSQYKYHKRQRSFIEIKIYCQDKNLTMSPIKTNINGMLHKANPSGAKFPLI